MPQLDTSTYFGQIFWFLCSFIFLWANVSFWMVPAYRSIVDRRSKYVKEFLVQASDLKDKIADLQEKTDLQLLEAQNLMVSLTKEAQDKHQNRLKVFQDQMIIHHHEVMKKFQEGFVQYKKSLDQSSNNERDRPVDNHPLKGSTEGSSLEGEELKGAQSSESQKIESMPLEPKDVDLSLLALERYGKLFAQVTV